jgi:hypothetical protein
MHHLSRQLSDIIQLTELVTPQKLQKLPVLNSKSRSKAQLLYNKITQETFQSEEELINTLFEEGPYQKSNYTRIRRELQEKLINMLFLVESNNDSQLDIAQAYYICHQHLAAINILQGKGLKNVAISIAEKTFKIAVKFEFTEIVLSLCKILRLHYGSIRGNKKQFTFYNKLVKEYSEVYSAELKVEEYFASLSLHISQSRSSKGELKEIAKQYGDELEKIISIYHSYRINYLAYVVIALRYEIAYDYENTIKTCDRALLYFSKKKHLATKTSMFSFYFRKVSSQILLGRTLEAENTTETCLKLIQPGKHNWFLIQEYRYILFNHSRQFTSTFKVYLEVITNKKFKKQYAKIQEAWYVYEAYIYYFYLRKAIKGPLNERLKKFRLNKFLNEVPTYSKDKRGMNISILILQILFLLHQEKYGQIIDRTEALRTYTHRYLRRDETFRSNCFIKMLMQLPKANFHKAAVIRKTKDLREKLSSVSIRHNQSAEVEAVPYEVLWDFVLGSLKHKIY